MDEPDFRYKILADGRLEIQTDGEEFFYLTAEQLEYFLAEMDNQADLLFD